MRKILTIPVIKLIINLLIIYVVIAGVAQLIEKSHKLISNRDEINILKLDVPWHHPKDNVAILFDQNVLANNPELYREVQTNIFTYDLIKRMVLIPLMVLVFIFLKRLILSINAGTFFKSENIKRINHLAIVVGFYIFYKFIFYQLIPVFMPVNLMVETVNFTTFKESALDNIVAAIDFKMLFVSIILYVISVSFKEGYQLKQETELTI